MANESKNYIDEQGGELLVKQIKQLIGRNLANDEIFIGTQAEFDMLDPKKQAAVKLFIDPTDNTGSSTGGIGNIDPNDPSQVITAQDVTDLFNDPNI